MPKKLPVKVIKKKKKLNLPLILGIGGGIILLIIFIIILAGSKKNNKSKNDFGDELNF